MSLRAQRGNLVAKATAVRRRVYNLKRTHVVIASEARQSHRRSKVGTSKCVQPQANSRCHCERSAAIPSPKQRRHVGVFSTSSVPPLPLRAKRGNPVAEAKSARRRVYNLKRTPVAIASEARQSRRRSNGGTSAYLKPQANPRCHCERSAAIPSPKQSRHVEVCTTSIELTLSLRAQRGNPDAEATSARRSVYNLNRTHVVIASEARQSHRRINGGRPRCVQPYRDCHIAILLAMTDQRGYA